MPFVSQVLNRPLLDPDGERLGLVKDFVIAADAVYPPILAVIFKAGKTLGSVPWAQISSVTATATVLRRPLRSDAAIATAEDNVWLVRDVLDRQIVDTEGVRLVRVNDIALAPINDELRVAGVDRSMVGIFRQLMPGWSTLGKRQGDIIDWEQLDLGPAIDVLRLKTPFAKLARMRPADIASVMNQMSPGEAADVLETLDDETAALALAEMDDEHQATVVTAMEPEEAADVLEEMAPDEAADVLGDLEEERATELMQLMEPKAALEVRSLLAYDEDSAGGLMTPRFITAAEDETADEVILRLRLEPPEELETHAIHVVDGNGRLEGWLSLWDLLLAPANSRVSQMRLNQDRAKLDDEWEDVARRMLHYRLLSLPVVDDEGRLRGVIAAGDIAERLAPRGANTLLRRHP